ncbi:MAG TPA: hypothetical protein VFO08_01565 [Methylomirabilota bacterium]|jgi:hypothetical protein|nr:hypothetical protein [Methylomirabilota bacterium]
MSKTLLLGLTVCVSLTACTTMSNAPPYSQAELRASCERRGGWWRGSLIPYYCEFQGAALMEAP